MGSGQEQVAVKGHGDLSAPSRIESMPARITSRENKSSSTACCAVISAVPVSLLIIYLRLCLDSALPFIEFMTNALKSKDTGIM